ncbi:Uncharacterized protein BM_BM13425 [Brugia malayi]|uniref:Bm13425 n=1 Tax=Brugia malayi TaxID=6279 RepID=A0A0K0IXS9_BRUMA|nr:Uncharacterized protein BM_BM13425 [Brugia malayi]CDP94405.2 Bm13425 [Brugia malayi]VIO88917.1 Uncharacterized protein BM_BM13425 [Brugia malayi]
MGWSLATSIWIATLVSESVICSDPLLITHWSVDKRASIYFYYYFVTTFLHITVEHENSNTLRQLLLQHEYRFHTNNRKVIIDTGDDIYASKRTLNKYTLLQLHAETKT